MFWELYTTYFKIVVYYCFFPLGRISYWAVEFGYPYSSSNQIVFSYLVFQILLYWILKIRYSYPGMYCLSSLSPNPQYDKLWDFFARVGLGGFFFFLCSHSQQYRNAQEANHWPFRPKYSSAFPVLCHHFGQPLRSPLWLLG